MDTNPVFPFSPAADQRADGFPRALEHALKVSMVQDFGTVPIAFLLVVVVAVFTVGCSDERPPAKVDPLGQSPPAVDFATQVGKTPSVAPSNTQYAAAADASSKEKAAFDLLRVAPPRPSVASDCPEDLGTTLSDESSASTALPFADLNAIQPNGITFCGHEIVFRGVEGVRRFRPDTKEWRYEVRRPVGNGASSIIDALRKEPLTAHKPPDWWPGYSWDRTAAVDAPSVPRWMIVETEHDGYPAQELLALEAGGEYGLPDANYASIRVVGTTAWLASPTGVVSLDLKTFELAGHVAIPTTRNLVAIVDDDRSVYFANAAAGLYSVQKSTGEVRTIVLPSPSRATFFEITDMIKHGRKLFVLMRG